jgi:CHAT domain-containing protein
MNLETTLGSSLEDLSILIISVPKTDDNGETKDFEDLPHAGNEAAELVTLLDGIDHVKVHYVEPRNATFDKVYKALTRHTYDILHFCGHSYYDDLNPSYSGIVLRDKIMQTGQISNTIRGRRDRKMPALCFINACESTKAVSGAQSKTKEENRLNIYGLARAFLDTGAYLLGSRWRVKDDTAMEFAKQFYKSLVKEEKSIGVSVFDARTACKKNVTADPFGWATYIYYGDPRLYFRKA